MEDLRLIRREQLSISHRGQRLPDVGFLNRGIATSVLDLKELHDEFDIENSAVTAFQVSCAPARCLQTLAHVPDLINQFRLPTNSEDRLRQSVHHLASKIR